jgi:hypothetical protein
MSKVLIQYRLLTSFSASRFPPACRDGTSVTARSVGLPTYVVMMMMMMMMVMMMMMTTTTTMMMLPLRRPRWDCRYRPAVLVAHLLEERHDAQMEVTGRVVHRGRVHVLTEPTDGTVVSSVLLAVSDKNVHGSQDHHAYMSLSCPKSSVFA